MQSSEGIGKGIRNEMGLGAENTNAKTLQIDKGTEEHINTGTVLGIVVIESIYSTNTYLLKCGYLKTKQFFQVVFEVR